MKLGIRSKLELYDCINRGDVFLNTSNTVGTVVRTKCAEAASVSVNLSNKMVVRIQLSCAVNDLHFVHAQCKFAEF